jgi:hypothetical protein
MDISVTPIDGINEKLKRAHEDIVNLEVEIARFFNESEYPIAGDEDFKVLAQKSLYHAGRKIPLRFSVIAGEVLYHLRSSLDHMAWLLAIPAIREKTPARVEFPVCCERFNKDGAPSLKGKIEIFASDTAKQIIEREQPYNGPDPLNDILWLIHDLDRKAKHRELPLAFTGFDLGSPQLNAIARFYAENPSVPFPVHIARQIDKHMKFSPIVVLSDVVKGQAQPIIPALRSFESGVWRVFNLLLGELAKC